MSILQQLGQVWILLPVVLLIVAGLGITLGSGNVRLTTSQGVRQMAGNLSSTMLFLGFCVLGLMMAQAAVGFNLRAGW